MFESLCKYRIYKTIMNLLLLDVLKQIFGFLTCIVNTLLILNTTHKKIKSQFDCIPNKIDVVMPGT